LPRLKDVIQSISSGEADFMLDPVLEREEKQPRIRAIHTLTSQAQTALDSTARPGDDDVLLRILHLMRVRYRDPLDCVKHCKYLIWQIPHRAYVEAYRERAEEFSQLRMLKGDHTRLTDIDKGEPLRVSEDDKFKASAPALPSEVLERITSIFAPITKARWKEEVLAEETNAGFHFKQEWYELLRWALSASLPGPKLALQMDILGKEEAMKRLKEATAIARSFDAGEL
jgi:hypothetical protein